MNKKKIFFALIGMILATPFMIIMIEVVCHLGYYAQDGRWIFEDPMEFSQINKMAELHPFLVYRFKKNARKEKDGVTISITDKHTRHTGAKNTEKEQVKILTLGGSTTFCVEISDEHSWPYILQQKLGNDFHVVNYGNPGYSTAEAIVQMALLVPEEKPDLVILYQGWNDIQSYHNQASPDYYAAGMRQLEELKKSRIRIKTNFEKFTTVSASLKLLTDIGIINQKAREYYIVRPYTNSPAQREDKDLFIDRIYKRNLETCLMLANQNNAKSLFIPQVLNYRKHQKEEFSWWTRGIKNTALEGLMREFNKIPLEVANSDSNAFFLPKVEERIWQEDDFIDYGHFSPKGSMKFANIVYKKIKTITLKENLLANK